MHVSYNAAFAVVTAALFVIIACSAPAFQRVILRFRPNQKSRYQRVSEPYKDEDGTATHESQAAYSYQLPRTFVLLFSIICLLNSLVLCVITTQRSPEPNVRVEQWLYFGVWVCP